LNAAQLCLYDPIGPCLDGEKAGGFFFSCSGALSLDLGR
jgi:hypothetical protein